MPGTSACSCGASGARAASGRLDARQRLVVDVDQAGAVLGGVARLGDDHGERLPDEADGVGGQRQRDIAQCFGHGALGRRHPTRDVGAGEHPDDARDGSRGIRVDASDAGVGVWAAHEDGVQAAGLADVVDVGAFAAQQAWVLDALAARADVGLWHVISSRGHLLHQRYVVVLGPEMVNDVPSGCGTSAVFRGANGVRMCTGVVILSLAGTMRPLSGTRTSAVMVRLGGA